MLEVVEIIEVIEQGATEPLRCRLSDGAVVVIKFPMNKCGTTALFNEYIGNSIAKHIGITVPHFGICLLSEEVVLSNEINEEIDADNCGRCFYSEYISASVPKIVWRNARNREVEKVLLLDCLLNNFDRHEGNILFDINTGTVYTIDYSHIFSKGSSLNLAETFFNKGMEKKSFLYKDILHDNVIYNEIMIRTGLNEDLIRDAASTIKSLLTREYIDRLLDDRALEDWTMTITREEKDLIKDFLTFRTEHIDEICEMIIEERRREK